MQIHGWGRYPRLDADVSYPSSAGQCASYSRGNGPFIARGLGRSYGDGSLAPRVLDTRYLDHCLSFDDSTGVLTCEAGATLDDIFKLFVPRGWFLPVTPGTRYITVGGAIASDVHGKNHHGEGCFSEHVTGMELLLGNGERVSVSHAENSELFHATCGGMGLTGIILTASVRLKPIASSEIIETTIKAPDLDAVLDGFEKGSSASYSVAWIDCLATGRNLGRSLLMLGEHAPDGPLTVQRKPLLPVPFEMPAGLLNHATVKAFNAVYYGKAKRGRHTRRVPLEPFFYPLDTLADWNRLYGKPGFVQYQFVLPKASGPRGLQSILERIARSGRGSFLAVLKVLGKANANLLSFPLEGYTLALDFKADPAVFELLGELDRHVIEHGGRIYLTKDARMSEHTFKVSYPRWQEFEEVRSRWHAIGKFASIQSRRLGLQ